MPTGEPLLNAECPEFLLSSIPQGGPRKCLSSLFFFVFFFLKANVDFLRKQVLETTVYWCDSRFLGAFSEAFLSRIFFFLNPICCFTGSQPPSLLASRDIFLPH